MYRSLQRRRRSHLRPSLRNGQIVGRATATETVAEVFVELREKRMKHWQAHAVNRAPAAGIGREGCHRPDADSLIVMCPGEQLGIGHFKHDGVNGMSGEQNPGFPCIPASQIDRSAILERVANGMQNVG